MYSQQLRERLQEKCPELMELSFGCWLRTHLFNGWNTTDFRFVYETYKSHVFVCENNDSDQVLLSEWDFEILGHEPQLSHLLKALGSDYTIDGEGYTIKKTYWDTVDSIWFNYVEIPKEWCVWFLKLDLTKLPCEQSEEVCERLLALMK